MKQLNILATTLVLTCFALFPATVRADDSLEGLDVTMVVGDDAGEIDASISRMRGPDDDGVDDDDWEDDGDRQRDEEDEQRREDDRNDDETD